MSPVIPAPEVHSPVLVCRVGLGGGLPAGLRAVLLVLAMLCAGCADPAAVLVRHEAALEEGELGAAQKILRDGLERHPDDVPLLCAAASLHLRPAPPEFYKPRLALHYAMRADQAARGADPEAALLLGMAHRAAGGLAALPQGEALLAAGLEQIGHPDANAPRLLRPFDPDLLVPTLENVLEQKLRWEQGRKQPTCPPEQLLVPVGRYPVPVENLGGGPTVQTEITIEAFCIERMPSVETGCAGVGERRCSAEEVSVVRSALAGLLWGDRSAPRCCAEPTIARVKN